MNWTGGKRSHAAKLKLQKVTLAANPVATRVFQQTQDQPTIFARPTCTKAVQEYGYLEFGSRCARWQ